MLVCSSEKPYNPEIFGLLKGVLIRLLSGFRLALTIYPLKVLWAEDIELEF